jgi:sodium transport system ATP-binding protein
MIQVRQLTKSFGAITAVNNVSFEAPDGAITGFLGANGAGKTTTLRAISGLLKPDAGTIRCGFGRLRGLTGADLARRVEQILSRLELVNVADRRTNGFSQGERMKVSLGCVLIHEPSHLLLDEPTNGLDVPTVRALRLLLKDLRDRGTCILFSSHVLSEIEGLCDRVVIVAKGRLVAEGTLDELRGHVRRPVAVRAVLEAPVRPHESRRPPDVLAGCGARLAGRPGPAELDRLVWACEADGASVLARLAPFVRALSRSFQRSQRQAPCRRWSRSPD